MVRHATPDDLPHLVASVAALFAEDGGTRDSRMDTTWPAREGEAYYRPLLDDADALCLVSAHGHLIGRLRRADPLHPGLTSAVLESMRVGESARRTGEGAALVAAFTDWAREHGATRHLVSAYTANTDALAFYRAQGFTPFETTLIRE